MLVLAVLLTRRVRNLPPFGTDTTGVLPVLWLLGNEPRLANVDQLNLDVLRIAAMYEVDPNSLLYQRGHNSGQKTYEGDESSSEQHLFHSGSDDVEGR